MRDRLVTALKTVLGAGINESGNLEHKLKNLGLEVAEELSDAFFEEGEKEEAIFSKGVDLGIKAEDETIYMVEIESTFLYYIGTEADIIRKISEKEEELLDDLGADDVTIEV